MLHAVGMRKFSRPQDLIIKCFPVKREAKVLPQDTVRKLEKALVALEVGKISSDATLKQLEQLRSVIDGLSEEGGDVKYSAVEESVDAVECLLAEDLLGKMAEKLEYLDFQARTVAVNFCCTLLQLGLPHGLDRQVLDYICGNHRMIDLLLKGCSNVEICTHSGIILRSCLKHEVVAKVFLERSSALHLLELVQHQRFEVSTEAFCSLRELLLVHKDITSEWILGNSSAFFGMYHTFLKGDDYVVQRQALKLLSELLLDPSSGKLMRFYVNDDEYLRIHMILLRNPSKMVQCEAFHVLKLFVANPRKPLRVRKILSKNQLGLIELIDGLQPMSSDDERFHKDKSCVIDKLYAIPSLPSPLAISGTKVNKSNGTPSSEASTFSGSTCGASTCDADFSPTFSLYQSL